jgi:apolipoprotein N-acyltransferase
VFGAVTYSTEQEHTWNSALVLHRDGTMGSRYDKVYPLPFGEAAPSFVDPSWYLQTIPNASHLNRGSEPGLLELDGLRFGPLICYEDVLPRYARRVADQGVHALLNLTNDSWFGQTTEQAGHLGLSVFRAVEHRRPLVRAVNAGVSAYVDPAGRIVTRTEVTDSDVDGYGHAEGFVADVPMVDPGRRTLYSRTGDVFALALVAGLVGLGWRRRRITRSA